MRIKRSYIALGTAVILLGSTIAFSEPGDENDPLVTLSYVNRSIEQVKTYIDTKLGSVGSSTGSGTYSLEVVNVSKGQFLIADGGTEIILRSGNATAVVSDLGGLCDITAGVDLNKDVPIPSNHLLLVPRDDGRGVYCSTDAVFMVRGDYQIR